MTLLSRHKQGGRSAFLGLSVAVLIVVLQTTSAAREPPAWRTITRVVDGDTLVLNGNEKVRLIGVNTPEMSDDRPEVRELALRAKYFLQRLAQSKKVRLEYDYQHKDRYGRTLAYLYLEDGTFVNAEIVKSGYGYAFTKYPFKYMERFRMYERAAREAKLGLWAGN
jgi:micrococcal nuclease